MLLSFAGDLAISEGWAVDRALPVLGRAPGQRDELCPKCVDTLAG